MHGKRRRKYCCIVMCIFGVELFFFRLITFRLMTSVQTRLGTKFWSCPVQDRQQSLSTCLLNENDATNYPSYRKNVHFLDMHWFFRFFHVFRLQSLQKKLLFNVVILFYYILSVLSSAYSLVYGTLNQGNNNGSSFVLYGANIY